MATWTIANLERNLADGGVTVAHWRVTESETVGDDTFTASSYGTVGFTPDADADGTLVQSKDRRQWPLRPSPGCWKRHPSGTG